MVSTILPHYPNYENDLIRGGEEKEEDEEEKSLSLLQISSFAISFTRYWHAFFT